MKIVDGFQKIRDGLVVDGELKKCVECGEPASSEVCNFCKIVSCLGSGC